MPFLEIQIVDFSRVLSHILVSKATKYGKNITYIEIAHGCEGVQIC
jgi:hypothetical protein